MFGSSDWAVIVGGSGGFGLAAAGKLARHGMNLCVVHRDRRAAMRDIDKAFDALRETGVRLLPFNLDALLPEKRSEVLDALADTMGQSGKVRVLLHAIAWGSLKLLAPPRANGGPSSGRERLAEALKVSQESLSETIDGLFDSGVDALHCLARPPVYGEGPLLDQEDFMHTIHAMGTNLVEWVQEIHGRRLFADDARVLSLTSEGNSVAWRGYAAVSAAKAVLESATRAIALEYAPFGIRANVIQAGVTDTAALRAIPGHRQMMARAKLRNPMGRLTTPEAVADVIYLLCTEEAAWVNGALLRVDGGEGIA